MRNNILTRHDIQTSERAVQRRIVRHMIFPLERHPYDPSVIRKATIQRKLAKVAPKPMPRRKISLLIAAHNEELVIGQTLRSAIAAGMNPVHIYVVDDNSSDKTSAIAKQIIPAANVVKVHRSGKGLALTKGA